MLRAGLSLRQKFRARRRFGQRAFVFAGVVTDRVVELAAKQANATSL